MSVEVVASGIKGGRVNSGSAVSALGSAADGTGAAAAGKGLDLNFFFVGLPLPRDIIAPIPPILQQHKQARTIQSQIGNCEPQEPDAVDPELIDPEESLAQDP